MFFLNADLTKLYWSPGIPQYLGTYFSKNMVDFRIGVVHHHEINNLWNVFYYYTLMLQSLLQVVLEWVLDT